MLNFEEASFQNLLIFGTKQTIKFKGTGIRYIYGENLDILESDNSENFELDERDISSGSGKSTLPINLLWVVYGEIRKKGKIALTRIANKKYKKNVEGIVIFNIDNKERYCVKRYRQFKPHGNTVYLYKWNEIKNDWEDLSRSDSNETQELINKIVGINYGTAMKAILFSRDDVQDFLDLPAVDRFKIFENIIQLNKFKEKFDKVYKSKLDLEKKLLSVSADYNTKLGGKKPVIEYFKKEIKALKQDRINNKVRIEGYRKQLAEMGDIDPEKVNESLEQLVSMYKMQMNHASIIVQATKELNQFKKDIVSNELKIEKALKQKSQYEDNLKGIKPHKCANCGELQNKEDYEDRLRYAQFLIDNLPDVSIFQKETEEIRKQIESKNETIETNKASIIELNNMIAGLELDKKLKTYIIQEIKIGKEIKLQAEIKQITDDLNALLNMKQDYSSLKMYIADLRRFRKDIKTIGLEMHELKRQIDICQIWLKLLDAREENSIKQFVISKIIPAFNSLLQENLDEVYNGLLRINFDSFLNEKIIYEGDEAQITELSTGERARINLCINFSIYELTRINLNASNVLFLDEVFNSMDVYSINKFLAIIKKKYLATTLIHIVGHSKGLEENLDADEVIKIQRKDRESKIIFV